MNKVKYVFSGATFLFAFTFVLSCSSDDESPEENTNTIDICVDDEYDTTFYDCVRGEIVGSCKGKDFYPKHQYCDNGEIIERCNGGTVLGAGTVTYCGQTYKTVVIGEQTWMAENLNYNAWNSQCLDNSEANCDKYGRRYRWATAMNLGSTCSPGSCAISSIHRGICPEGWHIPSNKDWEQLFDYIGGTSTAAMHLKAREWQPKDGHCYDYFGSCESYDTYGFSALRGGIGYYDFGGGYGSGAGWWSSNVYYYHNVVVVDFWFMHDDKVKVYNNSDKSDASMSNYFNATMKVPEYINSFWPLSIRCLQD